MSPVNLDTSKMLGFKILGTTDGPAAREMVQGDARVQAKVGMKLIAQPQMPASLGSKVGMKATGPSVAVKLGSKIGAKVGGKMV
ncbi:hypothetical protein [Hydrogenophaga sp.]|uniref:hypothetical protein n=1 Tax=Hydrogenophaga sp. TaxID=1904254 RepID=UPI002C2F8031|nr:hypothetical protein [Hydrogenophaga sp.]HMP12013.1 hypothetical protein [Hydrogenophaga sp.]